MAIVYNNLVPIRGVAAEPIFEEIFFENLTISESLVTFEEDIKAETIFTESSVAAVLQAYTCGVPTPAGTNTLFDTVVTPVKFMFYDEFCPDTLRFSRFKRDMKPGAFNTISDEYVRLMMSSYASSISSQIENLFWNNVTTATKSAVAGLTAGTLRTEVSTAEKALVAATTTAPVNAQWDGIVQRMIYNASNPTATGAVGGRAKVAGTTITSANVKDEYAKLFAAIPAQLFKSNKVELFIYAPYSHIQLITAYNNNVANFKDAFVMIGSDWTFNGIKIKFVPLPENVMIAAPKQHLVWNTDLLSDGNSVQLEKKEAASDLWFIKVVMTLTTHVANQKYNVLYVG